MELGIQPSFVTTSEFQGGGGLNAQTHPSVRDWTWTKKLMLRLHFVLHNGSTTELTFTVTGTSLIRECLLY
jgi:hypothetical protein